MYYIVKKNDNTIRSLLHLDTSRTDRRKKKFEGEKLNNETWTWINYFIFIFSLPIQEPTAQSKCPFCGHSRLYSGPPPPPLWRFAHRTHPQSTPPPDPNTPPPKSNVCSRIIPPDYDSSRRRGSCPPHRRSSKIRHIPPYSNPRSSATDGLPLPIRRRFRFRSIRFGSRGRGGSPLGLWGSFPCIETCGELSLTSRLINSNELHRS